MRKTAQVIHKQDFALSVQDAVENLSAIAQLDVMALNPIGIIGKNHFVIQNEEVTYPEVLWLMPETAHEVLPKLHDTYLSIQTYLNDLYEQDDLDWESPKVQKGIRAIMLLVGQAVEKLQKFASFIHKEKELEPFIHSDEYRKLQHYYLKIFSKKFSHPLEGADAWNEEWVKSSHAFELDLSKSGINNFEAIKEDEDYELFLLYDDANRRFLTPELVRNIELVCDFDELIATAIPEKMDKFLKREVQMRARQIYRASKPLMAAFYQKKIPVSKNSFPYQIHKMIVALLMAANPATISSEKKNSSDYFVDFQKFLREAYHLPDYDRMINHSKDFPSEDREVLLSLFLGLCHSFFTVPGGVKEEMIGLIHKFITKGEMHLIQERNDGRAALSFCNQLSLDEQRMREAFKSYPNSPLLMDLVAAKEPTLSGFDPLGQKNYPAKAFEIHIADMRIDLLRLPSPTRQEKVSEAIVDEEFLGFLEQLKIFHQKHLLVNLQDITSWQEAARGSALATLGSARSSLEVFTLNTHGDFYHQSGSFATVDDAKVFTEALLEQIVAAERWGFSFPIAHVSMQELTYFAKDLIAKIHTEFFQNMKTLSQKNRKDFIEIFYMFITLKMMEIFQPKSLSFTCKDSLDLGASFQASFYGFCRLLETGHFLADERENFLWLFHSQALLVRHRPANIERVDRALSMLDFLEEKLKKEHKKIVTSFSSLYSMKLHSLSVHPIA